MVSMQWLLSPIAVFAGMLMVVQSACNGMLEKMIDRPVTVAVISLREPSEAARVAAFAARLGERIKPSFLHLPRGGPQRRRSSQSKRALD
jgi:hypothetical protein